VAGLEKISTDQRKFVTRQERRKQTIWEALKAARVIIGGGGVSSSPPPPSFYSSIRNITIEYQIIFLVCLVPLGLDKLHCRPASLSFTNYFNGYADPLGYPKDPAVSLKTIVMGLLREHAHHLSRTICTRNASSTYPKQTGKT
jgi:hypothetical protein